MTQAEKRKIRGTNRGLIRGNSRRTTDLGRVRDAEYAAMKSDIVAKTEEKGRNRRKHLYEQE